MNPDSTYSSPPRGGALKTTALLLLGSITGCAGSLESHSESHFIQTEARVGLRPAPPSGPDNAPDFDGTLNGYLAFALKHSPQTRAAFERWRATTLQISRARRLPEPTLSFGVFLRSVETRVGPQRFKLGVSQMFPWPTKLSAGADATAERADAMALAFDAEVLAVKRDVANTYWKLWLVQEEHRIKSEHDAALDSLAGTVRGRVKIGAATLADLSQIELSIARHHDHKGVHREATRKISAALFAVIGAAPGADLTATDTVSGGLPDRADAQLQQLARKHPRVERHGHLAASEGHRASAESADRFPKFRVGFDYIETGDARMPGVPDSGKDAMIVSAGISIPLWGSSYSDSANAARALSAAHGADREAAMRASDAAAMARISEVRDAQRRIELYEKTLVPQAETTFQAVLGGYQTGRTTVASMILAERDLLDLQLEHARARAQHANAWAALEFIVGTALERRPVCMTEQNCSGASSARREKGVWWAQTTDEQRRNATQMGRECATESKLIGALDVQGTQHD